MTPGQSKAARSWLGWSMDKAAAEAGVEFQGKIGVIYRQADSDDG